jgi:hypothetical protein
MQRFLIPFILFLCSCGQSAKPVVTAPDDLVPQSTMVEVLADVHLLEASLSIRSYSPLPPQMRNHLPPEFRHDSVSPVSDPAKKDPLPYYNIFKEHKITQKQYDATMAWYAANPDKLNELYDQVIIELTKRQAEDRTGKKTVSGDSLKKQ